MVAPSLDQLPIDIHYSKLLDWLIDRKRTTRAWHAKVREIRKLVETALASLPNRKDLPVITLLFSNNANMTSLCFGMLPCCCLFALFA